MIPVENEPPSIETLDLIRQYVDQLRQLLGRLQKLNPGFKPPRLPDNPFTQTLRQTVERFLPDPNSDSIFGQLRKAISQEGLDQEALQGLWYMMQYSVQYQADMIKRRFTGDYQTDEWGLDWEFLETVRPFFSFLYRVYWRVETKGLEHIPDYGRALIVGNHSGQLPFDAIMVSTAIISEHPAQRLVRTLYATWFSTAPLFSPLFEKTGQVLANEENSLRLLEQDELVAVYPEGYKGGSKLFKDRYKLARFGRGGFIRTALKGQAPIIPVAIVGAEEIFITLHQSQRLAKLFNMPYFPITPTFPWLGLLGAIPLPTKWSIDFGPPITLESYGTESAEDIVVVTELTNQVRNSVQKMIHHRLLQRKSIFSG